MAQPTRPTVSADASVVGRGAVVLVILGLPKKSWGRLQLGRRCMTIHAALTTTALSTIWPSFDGQLRNEPTCSSLMSGL